MYEKDLITINGNTSQITEYNLYLRLLDNGINVIPIVTNEMTLFDQRILIIGTSEAYLNYLVSDKGVYEQTDSKVEYQLVDKKVFTNTQMNELVTNGILSIGQEIFNVVDSLEFGSIPTVVMNYQTYSLFVGDISEELIDGDLVYNFDSLYVIKENSSDFKTLTNILKSSVKNVNFGNNDSITRN